MSQPTDMKLYEKVAKSIKKNILNIVLIEAVYW